MAFKSRTARDNIIESLEVDSDFDKPALILSSPSGQQYQHKISKNVVLKSNGCSDAEEQMREYVKAQIDSKIFYLQKAFREQFCNKKELLNFQNKSELNQLEQTTNVEATKTDVQEQRGTIKCLQQ